MQHYFTDNPTSFEKEEKFTTVVAGKEFVFHTNTSVFSRKALDFGSRVLIESVHAENADMKGKLLDMGCGYGPISIVLGLLYPSLSITMADVNLRALKLAEKNVQENHIENIANILSSDVFSSVSDTYQYIVTNPPIRAGKQVVFAIYEGAFEHLEDGGRLYVVIQKKQGAPSSQKKLTELFGNCTVVAKESGYCVLCSLK